MINLINPVSPAKKDFNGDPNFIYFHFFYKLNQNGIQFGTYLSMPKYTKSEQVIKAILSAYSLAFVESKEASV
jgi:hypothetical protein